MVVILNAAIHRVAELADIWWNYCDPRTEHLPLARNPLLIVVFLAFYVYFVLSLGPRLMRNRKPFELRKVMLVYNAVQVIACGYLFQKGRVTGWGGDYNYICQPLGKGMEPIDFEAAFLVWLYMMLKITDLLDTVFMVLRKNFRQISFLHVYHHTAMVKASWIAVAFIPGGHHTLVGYINCFVHCLLYGYYFLSLYDARFKVAWWKKYITIVQIVQFAFNMVHEMFPLFLRDCEVNKGLSGLLVMQNLFMFVLFTDFYLKNYSDKAVAAKRTAAKKES